MVSEAATPMTHAANVTAEPVTCVIYAANVMAERDGRAGSVSGQTAVTPDVRQRGVANDQSREYSAPVAKPSIQ